MSTFPPAPPSESSHGTCLARSSGGQHVGLSTSISYLPHPWICLGIKHKAGLMAVFQAWLWSVGQALGTRTISFVSLPAPVDKRASPAAPESEADTLGTLGEWVLSAGLPGLVWNMSQSLADPEAKMPSGGHARLTLFESLI